MITLTVFACDLLDYEKKDSDRKINYPVEYVIDPLKTLSCMRKTNEIMNNLMMKK